MPIIDVKTLLDAALTKVQTGLNEVASVAETLVKEAASVVTIAAPADGSTGAVAGVSVDAQTAIDALKKQVEDIKGQYNALLSTHPTPPEGAAPLPLDAPPAEKPAEEPKKEEPKKDEK